MYSYFEQTNNSKIVYRHGEINGSTSESYIQKYPSLTANEHLDIGSKDSADLAVTSWWDSRGFDDQVLRHEDGSQFNLSSIDWNSVDFYYEYETGNSSSFEDYETIPTGRAISLAAFAIIFIVGLVGNGLVVYTVARYKNIRRGAFLYLLSLSVADILYLMVCLPALSVSYALVDWRFGRAFCKLENYISSVSVSVTALTILSTGLDRCLEIFYPKPTAFRTNKKTLVVISSTWAISCAVMAPRALIFEEVIVIHTVGETTLCSRDASMTLLKTDTLLNCLFLYLVPLLVNCVCHFLVSRNLRNTGVQNATRNEQSEKFVIQDRRRFSQIFLAITIIFAICWLPMHVYHLAEDFDQGNVLFGEYIDRGTVALLFSFGGNACNPLSYWVFSSCFRRHFKKVFGCVRYKGCSYNNTDRVEAPRDSQNEEKTQGFMRSLTSIQQPVSALSLTFVTEHTRQTNDERSTEAKSSTIPHLQPLLQKSFEL